MKEYIDRIYKTKRENYINYINDDYELVGEMYKNKCHKKEPYIFTISASNSDDVILTSSDPTTDVVPNISPTISNFSATASSNNVTNCSITVDNGGSSIKLFTIKTSSSILGELTLNIDLTKAWSSNILHLNYTNLTAVPPTTLGSSGTYTFIVTGLTIDDPSSFSVTATNSVGTSSSVTFTIPGSPTNVTAIPDDKKCTVSFTPPTNTGGTPITEYEVTSSSGGSIISKTGTSSPIIVSDLTNGTAYTFIIRAKNIVGYGLASSASSAVTPSGLPISPTNISASTIPSKILSITPSAGSKLVKLTFLQPSSNGSTITAYKISGYYTQVNNVNKSYKETITINVPTSPATSENYSIDSSNNVTITLYTKANMTFNVTSTDTGSTNSDKINNLISSATEATTKTLSTSVQPYSHVSLVRYPIGKEREDCYNNLQKNNNIRYCFIIIPVIFVILYFVMNMNTPKKFKTNKKF